VSVHRDEIRQAIGGAKIDEGQLTLVTTAMAEALLNTGLDVIACGWNTHPEDRKRWERVAKRTEHRLVWLDTRDRAVHSLIPPLEGWTPISYESAA
jgi:predicted kinase